MSVQSIRCRFRSVERGFKRQVTKPVKERLAREIACVYRRTLRNVCFIGVTGSCGKTTTTELVAAILAQEGPVRKSSYENTIRRFAGAVLGVSPSDRFCVAEISGHPTGAIAQANRVLRPRIGVVTCVGGDHYASFRNLEATAAEKGKLVELLPADGVAVLNADDPHVYAMRTRTRARVVTYGLSPEAMVRGENVACVWPERMSLDVSYADVRVHVQTQLVGTHWATTVLGALATGIAAGVSLDKAVAAVEAFPPVPHRMCPHQVPGDVAFIDDAWKAPLWTVSASIDFLRGARAERKILVLGSISDTSKSFYHRYRAVARQALDVADKILFVGEHSDTALRARLHPDDDRIMAFPTLYQANAFLGDYLRPGDLVLLKGTTPIDHMDRLVLARTDGIVCWRHQCGKRYYCVRCRLQHDPLIPDHQASSHEASRAPET